MKQLMLLIVSIILLVQSAAALSSKQVSSIVDFSPGLFPAKADAKFYYSINDELKYSDQIDSQATTLARGHITFFLVSPDGKKIAAVIKEKLLIVGTDSVLGTIDNVESVDKFFKPIGRTYFRDYGFQWTRDSQSIYLIRDEYGWKSQWQSHKCELWKYDLQSKSLTLVLKPFNSQHFFFGGDLGIFYSEPTARGDMQLKYFDGTVVTNAGQSDDKEAINLPGLDGGRPFYSFDLVDYRDKVLPRLSVRLPYAHDLESLVIHDRNYLTVTQGKGWDEYYYCIDLLRSAFLPGDRYFLVNVPYCDNYKSGQLLIDVESGRYQTVPPNTVVFVTLNTDTYPYYRITSSGIELK